jgi:hypothetical protein
MRCCYSLQKCGMPFCGEQCCMLRSYCATFCKKLVRYVPFRGVGLRRCAGGKFCVGQLLKGLAYPSVVLRRWFRCLEDAGHGIRDA